MATRKNTIATTEELLLSQRTAQRLVGDPEIAAAFDVMKESYIQRWTKTTPAEKEERELAYAHYKAVADVWAHLQRLAKSAHVRDLKAEKAQNEAFNG